ncbi:MAG: Rrf2 family transcriptional regulator [Ignavibacteriales bacterium]|nr:Rrf2 family transcriptional regulator [Ignavibacteriales bacterium]
MSTSTKLSASIKALCYLAESFPTPKSSAEISKSIGINASKIRMLLSQLSAVNIVSSIKGKKGGFILNKNPIEINMQEVYCGIENRKAFHLDVNKVSGKNFKQSKTFYSYFINLFSEIQVDIEDKMRNISLNSLMEKINIKSNYK